jgi:hypothetical protein
VKDACDKAIAAYIGEKHPMPQGVQRAANLATFDLYYGPLSGHDVSSDDPDYAPLVAAGVISGEAGSGDDHFEFTKALDLVADYVSDLPGTLYYEDESGCVMDREPQGEELETGELDDDGEPIMEWCEPLPYYAVDNLAGVLFGRELAKML